MNRIGLSAALVRSSFVLVAAFSLVACAEREEKRSADPQPGPPPVVAPQGGPAGYMNARAIAPRSNLLERIRMQPNLALSASASAPATASASAPASASAKPLPVK